MKQCKYVKTIATLVLTHLKMKLPTNYSLTNYICISIQMCAEKMTDVKSLWLNRNNSI